MPSRGSEMIFSVIIPLQSKAETKRSIHYWIQTNLVDISALFGSPSEKRLHKYQGVQVHMFRHPKISWLPTFKSHKTHSTQIDTFHVLKRSEKLNFWAWSHWLLWSGFSTFLWWVLSESKGLITFAHLQNCIYPWSSSICSNLVWTI